MLSVADKEIEALAAEIAKRVWQKVRRMIAKQQRELHDLLEEED